MGEIDLKATQRTEILGRKKTVPHLKLELTYNDALNVFESRIEGHSSYPNENREMISGETSAFLDSVKPTEIKVYTHGEKGLDNFNITHRIYLQSMGYEISDAQLAVTTRRASEMSGGGYYLDTGVTLSPYQVSLQIGRCTDEQKEQLIDWFDGLKKEHEQHIFTQK